MRRSLPLSLLLACAAPTATPPPANPAPANPAVHGAPRSVLRQLNLEVDHLERLLARADSPNRLRLRLARTLEERARVHRTKEYGAMERRYEAERLGDAEAARGARAAIARHAAAAARDLQTARAVLEQVPPDAPEAAAARADRFWLLMERRQWQAEALDAAREVVAMETEGALVAAAHLRLAEHAFQEGALQTALEGYDAVLATPGAERSLRAYAQYKRAWVFFNHQRWPEALDAFHAARRLAASEPATEGLRREAEKDLLMVHAHGGSAPAVVLRTIRGFALDAEAEAALIARHERILRDLGRTDDANAFRAVVERAPR